MVCAGPPGPIQPAAMALRQLLGVALQAQLLGTAVALGPRKNVLFFLNGKHSSAL